MRLRPPILALVALVAVASAGCPPRVKVDPGIPTPPPGTSWPEIKNVSGSLTTDASVTTYADRVSQFELTLPEGFSGKLSFTADPTGPPVRGAMKLRLTDAGAPPCVIDVAVEPATTPDAVTATVAAGREVFFVAETGEPMPALPVREVWTTTLIPVRPETVDLGYWLFAPDLLIRAEGRFPIARLGACKDALDALVRSIAASGDREAASR